MPALPPGPEEFRVQPDPHRLRTTRRVRRRAPDRGYAMPLAGCHGNRPQSSRATPRAGPGKDVDRAGLALEEPLAWEQVLVGPPRSTNASRSRGSDAAASFGAARRRSLRPWPRRTRRGSAASGCSRRARRAGRLARRPAADRAAPDVGTARGPPAPVQERDTNEVRRSYTCGPPRSVSIRPVITGRDDTAERRPSHSAPRDGTVETPARGRGDGYGSRWKRPCWQVQGGLEAHATYGATDGTHPGVDWAGHDRPK